MSPSSAPSPGASSAESAGHGRLDTAILARLAALEQAVFRSTSAVGGSGNAENGAHGDATPRVPLSGLEREGRQTANFLDKAYDRSSSASTRSGYRPLDIRVAESCRDSFATGAPDPVWLMPQKDAVAMVHDFVENIYHLMPIVHIGSTVSVIDNVYPALQAGNINHVDPAQVALILGICAACAFFWDGGVPCQHRFETEGEATSASLIWKTSALYAFEEAQRRGSRSLEGAQACAILAYLTYNMDGPSTRFYRLHTCSVTACRELGIHLVDSRGCESTDSTARRELKRRLWWHVAATDWMLGLNGGPLDGTYTVHPRQARVALPRNLNDSDLAIDSEILTMPPHVPTQASCFLQVIRLAEICRMVVDSQSPDDSIADTAYNERVLASDELFKKAIESMPPPLVLTSPIPEGAPRFLCLQRASLHLGFHSRRARLLRPFLLYKDSDGRQGTTYRRSRELCVRSAQTVLEISTSLLEHSLRIRSPEPFRRQILHHPGHHSCPASPIHRLGVVVNHLFCACAILAFECSLRKNSSVHPRQQHRGAGGEDDLDGMLVHAYRLLAAAGEECTVAADLVCAMRGVFAKYRVDGDLATVDGRGGQNQIVGSSRSAMASVQTSAGGACNEQQQIGPAAWPGMRGAIPDENQPMGEGSLETGKAWDGFDKDLDDLILQYMPGRDMDNVFLKIKNHSFWKTNKAFSKRRKVKKTRICEGGLCTVHKV
ncbi:hypothetical protein OOU_Y34scaffold00587g1 [Pyricularia oryzae Y34]|uniref:Xylanolytic transcriptional activator regulatory domain-containing protein n=2 Tax=Pyricularia oryzae TaxID=318829 RepID=A0AA97NWJ6_PYRO3|nr:hypothetical protein OOU_Y34scaffold00587g1 [Pyricularia oryzae Y34]